ncbi:alpha/beta hydrolase [Chloroflexi bacterium TSY]|nr:alpha/beta hydrolase [Chloroflexi bacterium TSY]
MSEITIKTAYSEDGTTITYDVMGHGPHLILLHGGFLQTRQAWHDVGYVKQFAKAYTTIAIDLRGHGQSGSPISPSFYAADKIIADILSVADAEAMTQFALVGFSLGQLRHCK